MNNVITTIKSAIKRTGGDTALWVLLLLLSLSSIVIIYSSTGSLAYARSDGDTTSYLVTQTLYVMIGLATVYVVHLFDYEYYFKHNRLIFAFAIFCMLLTFLIGVEINGEKRWLGIPGTPLTFQPSDLLKIALVIIVASQLAIRQKIMDKIMILPSFKRKSWQKFPRQNREIVQKISMPIIFPIAISAILVLVTNLSTALIISGSCLIVLILGRVRAKEIWRLIVFAIGVLFCCMVIFKVFGVSRVDTWISRTTDFFGTTTSQDEKNSDNDTDRFQAEQASIAVASGWYLGKGPGLSTQRSNLPHPYSDYAYAFIIEEYGVLGAIFFLFCYLCIFYRAIAIFRRCDKPFPAILVLGLSLMITLQAMLHMGVSVGVAPVTGQTLPIISKGGSSMFFTCIMFGIILGVSRQISEKREKKQLADEKYLITEEWGQVVLAEDGESIEEDDEFSYIKTLFYEEGEDEFKGVIWDETKTKNNS